MNKDWTKEDNISEFKKERKSASEKVLDRLIERACLFTHNSKQVGAVVEKFKRIATPEELEALKNMKAEDAGQGRRIV